LPTLAFHAWLTFSTGLKSTSGVGVRRSSLVDEQAASKAVIAQANGTA
jgi:uncharacterized membrane protein